MFKQIGQFFIIVFMVFGLSANAYANEEDDALSGVAELQEILDTSFNEEDYFHHILEFMWGSFIFDEREGKVDVSPLSKVVGFVNVLALILGIVIVTYVSLGSVINSAASGEVLGKNWSTYWLPLRTAMSFGLIIPSSAGAYTLSTVQVLVIKLIIIASTSATFLWTKSVNDIFKVPNSREVLATAGYPYQAAYDISSMAFCSASSLYASTEIERWYWFDGIEEYSSSTFITIHFRGAPSVTLSTKDVKELIGSGRSRLALPRSSVNVRRDSFAASDLITRISFADGQCGSISFDFPKSLQDPDYNEVEWNDDAAPSGQLRDLTATNNAKVALIKKTQMEMLTLFEKVFNHAHYIAGDEVDKGPLNGASFDKVIMAFIQSKDPSVQTIAEENSETAVLLKSKLKDGNNRDNLFVYTEEFVNKYRESIKEVYDGINTEELENDPEENRLTKGGWVLAGAAYFKMSDYVSIASQTFESISNVNPASPNVNCNIADSESFNCVQKSYLDSAIAILDMYYGAIYRDPNEPERLASLYNVFNGVYSGDEEEIASQIDERFTAAKSASLSSPTAVLSKSNPEEIIDAQTASLSKVMFSIIEFIGQGVGEDVSQLSTTADSDSYSFGTANPYQDAIMLGHGMNTIKVMAYTLSQLNNVSITLARYAQSATSGILTWVGGASIGIPAAIIEGVLEAFMPVLFAVITLSTTLAWTLAFYLPMMPVILWTVLVSAYCLIVIEAVIAAPLAIILAATPEGEGISGQRMESAIKMLAAVLLRPSLMIIGLFASIYIAKISYIIFITLFWPQATVYIGEGLFSTFAIIVIYVTVLHQILSRSIMVMDTLPSSILQWIGGGGNAEFGQQGLQSVSQVVEGGGDSLKVAGKDFMEKARQKRNGS